MLLRSIVRTVLPPTCPACGATGSAPCPACWRTLRPAPVVAPPPGVDVCRSLLLYEGAGRELIARLKYRNARASVPWLAEGMARLVGAHAVDPQTVVTWAPTSARRRHERGFDQAELLADAVARHLRRPCVRLLRRSSGPPQTGRHGHERRAGAVAFTAVGRPPATVVLVDDVLTTGATIAAAAEALRVAPSTRVIAVTAGRTPLKVVGRTAEA